MFLVWQNTIVNDRGDIQPGAFLEIKHQVSGANVQLYADSDGNTPISNPTQADEEGFVRVYIRNEGRTLYRIRAFRNGFERIWENELIGVGEPRTAAEQTAGVVPVDFSYPPGHVGRYGGKFDNSTDDTTAIQNAFNSGHDVQLGDGVSVITEELTISVDGIEVYGGGKGKSIIRQSVADKHGIIVISDNVNLHDFTIQDVTQTGATEYHGIAVRGGNNVTIERVRAVNCADAGIRIGYMPDSNDPSQTRSTDCRVINCEVEGSQETGIELIGAINPLVTGCITKNTGRWGIRCLACRDAKIMYNTCIDFGAESTNGLAGIIIGSGTIPGPVVEYNYDPLVANNTLVLESARTSRTSLIGIHVQNVVRACVQNNRIRLSDLGNSISDMRGIDVSSADAGEASIDSIFQGNIVEGDLETGILIQDENQELQVIGNVFRGFSSFGIRVTASPLTGKCIANTFLVGDPLAVAMSQSTTGTGRFVLWANDTDAADNRSLQPNGSGWSGSFDQYVSRFTRSNNDLVCSIPHALETGDRVQVASTGTLPSGLSEGANYYVIWQSATTVRLATTMANAVAGTNITLNDAGTGNHTIYAMRGVWANAVRSHI